MASRIPCTIFLSAGTIVASAPPRRTSLSRRNKIIGTQTNPPNQSFYRIGRRIVKWLLDQATFKELLQDKRTAAERGNRLFDAI